MVTLQPAFFVFAELPCLEDVVVEVAQCKLIHEFNDTTKLVLLTSRLATRSMEAYISGECSATRNVVPFNVVTTSAVWPFST